ncbi:tRNA-dihydrouridine synthase family protein [Myxococcota bacterium]|nr:tRNA-dihydrouridine synthase family protein [Myxococcota bacterium]
MDPQGSPLPHPPDTARGEERSWTAPPALEVRGVRFDPALLCAPMAGISHAPFRRLVADFGGCGGFFTEMLPARWLLSPQAIPSPAVLRRPREGPVVYQVLLGDPALAGPVVRRLDPLEPVGIDLNCACPAPVARSSGSGGSLFSDRDRLAPILAAVREAFPGLLSVKIRLGDGREGWEERLFDRIRLFEDLGVDLVTLHPRFTGERWNRRPRDEWYEVVTRQTRLPILASGNVLGPSTVQAHPARWRHVSGLMIGRMAAIQPWVFAAWGRPFEPPPALEVWDRFCAYVLEDYGPQQGFWRIKAWAPYYAQNFLFGHRLASIGRGSRDLDSLLHRARQFLAADPERVREPSLDIEK